MIAGDGLLEAVAGGAHDLVLANYRDAADVQRALETVLVRPGVMPLVSNPTTAVVAEARGAFKAVLVEKMDPIDALEEIDKLMKIRRQLADASRPR